VSIDLEMVLDCSPAAARNALKQLSPGLNETSVDDSVIPIGPRAALVLTHFRFPTSETSNEWSGVCRYVRSFAKLAGHADPRGVLVVSDSLEVGARSYERFVERTGNQGCWVRAKGAPQRSAETTAGQRHRSKLLKRPPERALPSNTKLACFVLPRAALSTEGSHAAIAAKAALEDGTMLVVVREIFSDPEALLRYVLAYPKLASLATDARGLLAIPASSYAAACQLRGYDELVAQHAPKAKKGAPKGSPGHYWLKVSDLDALKEALDGSRDDSYTAAREPSRRGPPPV
jgi:hypothetical protein